MHVHGYLDGKKQKKSERYENMGREKRHSVNTDATTRNHTQNMIYGVSVMVSALLNVRLPTGRFNKTRTHSFAFWTGFRFFSAFGTAITNLACSERPDS